MKNNKKGFTLAELLIVIAIMAILIAIAIPVFSAQLEKARDAVDASAQRSAMSIAEAHYLLNHGENAPSGGITCYFVEDANHNMEIGKCSEGDASSSSTSTTHVKSRCKESTASTGHVGENTYLTVKVDDGVVTPDWVATDWS